MMFYCLYIYDCVKWKNHFYEMKWNVGMSGHEKERHKLIHPSLHLCSAIKFCLFVVCVGHSSPDVYYC